MKVGVDGVTLGAWTDVSNVNSILDIGTGSGLIALMLAQRSVAQITATDIQYESYFQAKENVAATVWKDRIGVFQISLQEYLLSTNQKFDLIVCNPPYFINALKSPSTAKTIARHNDSLTQSELILGVHPLS